MKNKIKRIETGRYQIANFEIRRLWDYDTDQLGNEWEVGNLVGDEFHWEQTFSSKKLCIKYVEASIKGELNHFWVTL
jgi:hypothetical protein